MTNQSSSEKDPMSLFSMTILFLDNHRRWLIVGMLFLVAVVNNLDRQALSVLGPTLREKLSFGAIEYSYIVAAFLSAYTLGYTFSGNVLDRFGVRVGLAVALAFWSLAGMLHAIATGWVMLAVFRFLLGLGESFNSPAGVKAISEWIPPSERGLCMAIFSNGNVIGAMLAPPLVSFLVTQFNWRWGFIITGLFGFLLLAIWWRYYDDPEEHSRISKEEHDYIMASRPDSHEAVQRVPMLTLLSSPVCLGLFFARFLTDSVTYFYSFWLPDYLTHSRGFTLALIGLVGWLPFLASDIGGLGGGALSDWWIRRGWASRRARLTLMLGAAALMPIASIAVRTNSSVIALCLIAILFAAQSCWMANLLTLISESVPHSQVGTLLALTALGGGLGGILSTLVAGRVIFSYGYVPVFTVFGVVHLMAFGVIFFAIRKHDLRR